MTVIATDGHSMASDGLVMESDVIIGLDEAKIERLTNGSLYGSAGDCVGGDRIRDWLNDGADPDTFPRAEDTRALVLTTGGVVHLYDGASGGRSVIVKPPMAIGSGMDIAIGAMDAGATPAEAVEITMRRVATCGGKVTNLNRATS